MPKYFRAEDIPLVDTVRSPVVGSNLIPRVSSATLNPLQSAPGIPYHNFSPKSTQTGIFDSKKFESPYGVPKKKTSWRVGLIIFFNASGNILLNQGPQAKIYESA